MPPFIVRRLAPVLFCVLPLALRAAQKPILVPLIADHWHLVDDPTAREKPGASFFGHEGFPQGAVTVKSGSIALNDFIFRNGTIEYDFKALDQDIPGIQFRTTGDPGHADAEEFYVRTFPECRASNDCVQYAPVIHGFMLWNSYPQYQAQAPILDGWNHVRLVVNGRRMNVYINGSAAPVLAVGALQGTSTQGGIQLRGPAVFANLTITPDATESLPPTPTPDPTAADAGMVRHWLLGPQTPARFGEDPAFAELPAGPWQPLDAGRFGLVNLNRALQLTLQPTQLAWLRTSVTAATAGPRRVSLGWIGHAWIFVNGQLVTQGKNFYDPEFERRTPDGRLSLQNGSFDIPLVAGTNTVVLALYTAVHDDEHTPNRYGAGAILHFDDPRGLRFGPAAPSQKQSGRRALP